MPLTTKCSTLSSVIVKRGIIESPAREEARETERQRGRERERERVKGQINLWL